MHTIEDEEADPYQDRYAMERDEGRPGQAAGLLAARRNRTKDTTSKGFGPVPVTPDASNSKTPKTWMAASPTTTTA